eukprot:m.121489 g.121489  ORF g.121489 m.121489 type:complete len:82 (+) comp13387_c0_seq2:81-326(+)
MTYSSAEIAALRAERDSLQNQLAQIRQRTLETKKAIAKEIADAKLVKESTDSVKQQSASVAERLRTLCSGNPVVRVSSEST